MVRKHSKRGLNTGNTIRRYARESALHEHRRYGCLTVCSEVAEDESYAAQDAVRELTDMFPSTEHIEIEYSLNKQRRWELPEYIKSKIGEEVDSTDVQMTMIERDINVPTCAYRIVRKQRLKYRVYPFWPWFAFDGSMAHKCCWTAWPTALGRHIEDRDRCKCYHSNLSAVQRSACGAGMTVASAKRGCRAEDHMTKADRRQLKKVKTEEETDSLTLPKFECCISYGPSSTGKLYLDASNHQQQVRNTEIYNRRDRSYLKGPNKRKQKDVLEVDYSSADDKDIDGDTEGEEIRDSLPSSASLSDFLISSKNKPQSRRKKRRSHGRQRRDTDNDEKTHIQYMISLPDNPTIYCTKPMLYIPTSSHALIKSSDLSKQALVSNYGDKYREAYCTPRTITLSLSVDVGDEELYMVMVVACEGKDVDWCRIYCSGHNVTFELSALSTVEGKVYELFTLVCLALEHRQIVLPARETTQDILNQSAVYYRGKGSDSNLCTSQLCDVIKSALVMRQQAIEAEIEDYNENNDADYVFLSPMQCSICLEDINDSTLHTAVLPCQHDFCNQCWNRHLCTAIYQGLVHMTCMQCNTQLDPVFIMSMVEFSTYRLFEFLLAYSLLSRGQVVKSCPAIGCHRLLHCDKELMVKNQLLTIRCPCSRKYCFRCLKEPHWPLPCDQLTNYQKIILSNGMNPWLVLENEMRKDVSWCKCISNRDKKRAKWWSCYHWCAGCLHLYCYRCYKLYRQAKYHPRSQSCVPSISWKSNVALYPSQRVVYIDILRSYRTDLCDVYLHRGYKSCWRPAFAGYVKNLLANAQKKRPLRIPRSCSKQFDSLHDLLNQIVEQIVATHNLLEYCCFVNVFKKGSKYSVPTISLLSYSVGVLERELSSNRCNQYTVDRLVKYYGIVKSNTHLLVRNISLAFSLLQPSGTE